MNWLEVLGVKWDKDKGWFPFCHMNGMTLYVNPEDQTQSYWATDTAEID